jgi:predicted alpha-1,2-mannosidase
MPASPRLQVCLLLIVFTVVVAPEAGTPAQAPAAAPGDLAALVNPLIGTSGGGNTFPGAVRPFGMFSWSPENTRGDAADGNASRAAAPGGYHYEVTRIRGFSLTHLSGTGCRGASGDIPFMPLTREVTSSPSADATHALFASDFSHDDESARAGAYDVTLASGITVQLAATLRSGAGRFSYPRGGPAVMLVRSSDTQIGSEDAEISVDTPSRTISGWVRSGNFCGYLSPAGRRSYYTLHFVAIFDRPFTATGTWQDDEVRPGTTSAKGGTSYGPGGYPPAGKGSGAYVSFAPGSTVNVRVGISYVSAANARRNLTAEQPAHATVASVSRDAHLAWNRMLGRVQVAGGSATERRIFYTALYHSLLHMNVFNDVNGEYRGFDGQVHLVRAPQRVQYANFSGWDVYRSQVQLVALLEPRIAGDMAQSLFNQATQNNGVWDRWTHNNGATSVMEGDPSPPAVASMAAFGARDFDMKGALASLKRAATVPTPLDLSNTGCRVMCRGQRPSLDKWLSIHYIPTVSNAWGGAGETLEDATADFALAQLAQRLGDSESHRIFMERSDYWRNIFNASPTIVVNTGRGRRGAGPPPADAEKPVPGGYIQNRNDDGTWPPLDPASSTGFAEGSAVQYTWMVPFNLRGLVEAIGSKARANQRLEAFFKRPDGSWALTRSGGLHAELSNEPSVATPFVYLYTGQPHKAQEIVRHVQNTLWKDAPDGIPGNDDLGAMSSWYAWTAIGLYPGIPGRAELLVTTPLFPRIVVHRASGQTITVEAPGASTSTSYVQGLRVNGRASSRAWLPESFVLEGGHLSFIVGSQRVPGWGSSAADEPPSFSPGTR